MAKTLVLGVGNVLLADEGAGVHAMRYLQDHYDLRNTTYLDAGTLSFTLAADIAEADNLIVFDAAQIDAKPGTVRVFDVSDPHNPKQIYEKVIGKQLNMVSQSWDGKRLYFTSSLLANWDKKGEDNEQFLKVYDWDGKELKHRFSIDFYKEGLGRPHIMRFGAKSLYSG